LKHKIIKYYEGAISITEIEQMTIPEIIELNRSAVKIEQENKKAIDEQMRKQNFNRR
jgi:hypothetical protein